MQNRRRSIKHISSAKINRLQFMFPIFLVIFISSIYAQFVLLTEPIGENSTPLFESFNQFFVALNILIIVVVSIASLFVFFHFLRKKWEFTVKILAASFILGGVLSTLLFGKLVFTLLGLESPLFLLIIALVGYVGAYFAYLVMVDALSNRMKNFLFIICSGALGSFIGVLLPPIPVIGILLVLSILDLVLINRKTVEKKVGEANYEKLILKVAVSNQDWGIGIGDLTCYSIVVSNTLANMGLLAGTLSLLLILLGSFLSLVLVIRMVRIPGLPIAIFLSLLPSITILLFF